MERRSILTALAITLTGAAMAQGPGTIRLQNRPDLNQIRAEIQLKRYKFTVGDTGILNYDLKQLTGDLLPANIAQIARAQEPVAKRILDLDRDARNEAVRRNPSLRGKIYEFNIIANPNMKRWDWRTQ